MNKNKIIGIVVAVVVVIFAVGVVILTKRSPRSNLPGGAGGPGGAQAPSGPVTREAAPQNIVVPAQGAKNLPQNVAVPQSVSQASQVSSSDNRKFSIVADNDKFVPDTVIVNKGDVVDIVIAAVDKNYDFTQPDYGTKLLIAKGTSNHVQFGANASGKFTFYCASCGGPDKGPIGYLVVAPKP